MRCACPMCGDFMPQAEYGAPGCICPGCLYRCAACMGTPGLISREKLREALALAWQPADGPGDQNTGAQREDD